MAVRKIKLAEEGPEVSRIVHGAWRLAEAQSSREAILALIKGCLEVGITTFDHADLYGDYACEEIFGRALALEPSLRDQMQLISKCGIRNPSQNRPPIAIKHYDTSAAHIIASAENSIKQLNADYLDLLLIHRPDPMMDAQEVAEAFTKLRQSGKVLHFGVSNFMPWQFDLLASYLDFPLVTNQIEISVLNMTALHNGVVDHCQKSRIAPMAWSPFGGGRLFEERSKQAIRLRVELKEVANQYGAESIDQIALAWLLNHPAKIVPIIGSSKLERIEKSARAERFSLAREHWFSIWSASTGANVP